MTNDECEIQREKHYCLGSPLIRVQLPSRKALGCYANVHLTDCNAAYGCHDERQDSAEAKSYGHSTSS